MKNHFYHICMGLIAAFMFLTACANRESIEMSSVDKRLTEYFTSDNSQAITDMEMQEYDLQQLQGFFGELPFTESMAYSSSDNEPKFLSIAEVHEKFPIQCLRYNGRSFYAVYKVKEGGYYYVFWAFALKADNGCFKMPDESYVYRNDEVIADFTVYLSSCRKKRDFSSLIKGVSTAADVLMIDPATELTFFLSSGIYSYSLLINGKVMRIRYKRTTELLDRTSLIIEEIKVVPKDKTYSKLASVFAKDLP